VAAIHHEPPKVVIVTTTVNGALCPLPPVTVKEHAPAATPVTLNGPAPELGETVAIALQEFGCPPAGVVTVNPPP